MNKTLLALAAVAGLVVGLFAGYYAFGGNGGKLGAVAITADSALNQARLQNELSLLAGPTAGWLAGNSVMGNLTVSSATVQSSSITVTGAAAGDYVLFGESTSTANAVLTCGVSAANTVLCTKESAVPGLVGVAAVTSTVYVLDLPKATFVSPTGL